MAGLVIGTALAVNTVLAVSIGGVVPLLLKRFGQDPGGRQRPAFDHDHRHGGLLPGAQPRHTDDAVAGVSGTGICRHSRGGKAVPIRDDALSSARVKGVSVMESEAVPETRSVQSWQ